MKRPEQLQDKFIVGLSGGIGSGKTTVSDMFAELKVDVIDADIVAREVVAPYSEGLNALVQEFSKDILTATGELDRAKLRKIAFANDKAKQTLNQILHPLIRKNMLNQLEKSQSSYCMLVAPLLFENNLQSLTNCTLVIDLAREQQLKRTLDRDGGDTETIENIIAAQMDRTKRNELADDIIDNNGDVENLQARVLTLHKKYMKLAKQN